MISSNDNLFLLICLGTVFSMILFGLTFYKPKYSLYFLLILRPIMDNINMFRTFTIPGLGLNVWQAMGIAVPGIMLFVCFIKKMDAAQKRVQFFKHPLMNAYFLFTLFCLPSLITSNSIVDASASWLKLFTFWVVVIFADFALNSRKDVVTMLLVFIISSFYPLCRLSVDLITGKTYVIGGLSRLTGGYFHMSILSIMLLFFLPSYFYFLSQKSQETNSFFKRLRKPLLFFGMFMVLVFIYKTNYRTAFMSVAAFIFSLGLFRKKYFMLLVVGFLAVLTIINVPALRERFIPLFTVLPHLGMLLEEMPTKYDTYLSGRFGAWRNIITIFLFRSDGWVWFFGYGVDPVLRRIAFFGHNDFIYVTFHYGIFAAIAFYTFLYKMIRLGLHYSQEFIPQLVCSLCIAIVTSALSHPTFFDVRNLMYLAGYIAILLKYIETDPGQVTPVQESPGEKETSNLC